MVSPCGWRIDRSLPSANRTDDAAQEAVPMADRERLTSPRLCAVRAGAVGDVGALEIEVGHLLCGRWSRGPAPTFGRSRAESADDWRACRHGRATPASSTS